MLAVLKHVQKPKKNVKTEKSMFLKLNVEFISQVRQFFFFNFHLCFALVKIYWGYSMVWHWIWNYFASKINFIFNVQNIEFSIDYIFYGIWTCFFQILDTVCKTWRDVTIAYFTLHIWHFYSAKVTDYEDIMFVRAPYENEGSSIVNYIVCPSKLVCKHFVGTR